MTRACPPGVFNLVNGDGPGVGAQLSTHPDVEMISFTGSTRAGRAISKAAAETLKRVTLELGGKGANVIFADADDRAVERGVRHMMDNTGQSCNAPSRMLVERPIYDRAVEIAAEVANAIKVGSAHEDGKHIGPVVNKRQWDQIQGYIQKGIDEGARLIAGGPGLPEGFNRGFYVKPTIFADVVPGMTIEREEIFGPVLCMIPFEGEEEAVRIANDTPYGLTNYVQSQDGAKRNRMALRLKSGHGPDERQEPARPARPSAASRPRAARARAASAGWRNSSRPRRSRAGIPRSTSPPNEAAPSSPTCMAIVDALHAVLDDLKTQSPDLTVNLGDCLSGPLWPAETADLLIGLGWPTVRGNHDRWLITPPDPVGPWEADALPASVARRITPGSPPCRRR